MSPVFVFTRTAQSEGLEAARCLEAALALDPARSMAMVADPEKSHVSAMLRHVDELATSAKLIVDGQHKHEPGETLDVDGPYLGRKPPGDTPFLAILSQWGQSGTSCDFGVGDPGVGVNEFPELLAFWGQCP